jgi:hypothetical protein
MGEQKLLSLETHKYKTTFTLTTTIILRFSTRANDAARCRQEDEAIAAATLQKTEGDGWGKKRWIQVDRRGKPLRGG